MPYLCGFLALSVPGLARLFVFLHVFDRVTAIAAVGLGLQVVLEPAFGLGVCHVLAYCFWDSALSFL